MVDNLPEIWIDPTLEAVKAKAEAVRSTEGRRTYLGASLIGHGCERYIWYSIQPDVPRKAMGWQGCFATEDGHRTEELAIDRLRMVDGVEVWDKIDGKQIGYTDYDGKIRGNLDGVIKGILQSPATPHVLEIKCCNIKKFDAFKAAVAKHGSKQALNIWDFRFYCQALLYMHYMDLTRHYLVVLTPGGRDMASCRTNSCPAHAKALIQKSKRIIDAEAPPARIMDDPSYYICKFCEFREVCHGL